ncbi:hypothetical protein HID58_093700 [Brassica napus]|uniref:Uncharacterized protein n=2 Tax=Brassica TaxID=3705 RepID=A0ABQ7XBQ0_BRANA|nr:hypothetical protein HID58_093700 [Brassica napus]
MDGNTGHMNLAFVRIWSEVCPSDCEGTSQSFAHQTRDCSSNGEVWGYGFMMTCSKISKHVFSSNMRLRESRTRKDVRWSSLPPIASPGCLSSEIVTASVLY